jgi:hypothetical protein
MRHRSRRHRELPLPASFRRERPEHWLDKRERELEEHEELLRKLELESPPSFLETSSACPGWGNGHVEDPSRRAQRNGMAPGRPNRKSPTALRRCRNAAVRPGGRKVVPIEWMEDREEALITATTIGLSTPVSSRSKAARNTVLLGLCLTLSKVAHMRSTCGS